MGSEAHRVDVRRHGATKSAQLTREAVRKRREYAFPHRFALNAVSARARPYQDRQIQIQPMIHQREQCWRSINRGFRFGMPILHRLSIAGRFVRVPVLWFRSYLGALRGELPIVSWSRPPQPGRSGSCQLRASSPEYSQEAPDTLPCCRAGPSDAPAGKRLSGAGINRGMRMTIRVRGIGGAATIRPGRFAMSTGLRPVRGTVDYRGDQAGCRVFEIQPHAYRLGDFVGNRQA